MTFYYLKPGDGDIFEQQQKTFTGDIRFSCIDRINKGFSRPRHLQGKECNHWLVGQAHGFPLFDPM